MLSCLKTEDLIACNAYNMLALLEKGLSNSVYTLKDLW